MAVLQNYEGSYNDAYNVGTSSAGASISQSFQLQADATVTSISIYGGKGTAGTQPGTMKVELLSGSISGTVIATTNSFSSSVMAAYTSPAWYEFTFAASVVLTANTTYYLKLTALSGSTNDVYRWGLDNTSPTYTLGSVWVGTTETLTHDALFRINGTEGGGASGPANLKSYNTNIKANIKSINTNLIANVKSLNTNV